MSLRLTDFASLNFDILRTLFSSFRTGAEKLVRHLSASNVPIAVATSSGLESVELKTTNHKELFKLFHHIVAASSDPTIKQGKPAPDVFLACASRFSDQPEPTKVSIRCFDFIENKQDLVFPRKHNGL